VRRIAALLLLAPVFNVSKRRRIAFALVGIAVLLVCGAALWFDLALHHVPRFYEEAGKLDPAARKKGSEEMLHRTAELASDANRRGHWKQVFTAEQINGWLAVDLVENHPLLLPPALHDPRVAIHDGQIIVGCQYEGQVSTVASLEADVSLQELNRLAVRIRRARAGGVPLPLDRFLPEAMHTLENAGCIIELRQAGADPVLLITLNPQTNRGRTLILQALAVREGEVEIAGETK
jgi:hypothetical protein